MGSMNQVKQAQPTSVVNRDCQVHDVDNLFVIDASVHVTNGGFDPCADDHSERIPRLRNSG